MKTATIVNSYTHGSAQTLVFKVTYRGKLLLAFEGPKEEVTQLCARAVTFAREKGFTHFKFINN